MNIATKKIIGPSILLVASLALTSCGDSDLIELQEQQLDVARTAVAQAELGAAEQEQIDQSIDLSQYNLVFSDEFQSETLDASKWNTSLTWGPDLVVYNQMQYFVDVQNNPDFGYNPFVLDGDILAINATRTPEGLRSSANEQTWLSGVLTTADKFEFTYGYVEARLDPQAGTGLWSAFWMLSAEFENLKPELFIMENDGARPESIFHNYNYTDSDGNLRSPGQWELNSTEFSEGFQTVGVAWSPEELMFYINGVPRFRVVGENVSSQDMYLIMSLAVGGVWTGTADDTTPEPSQLLVDYVRVYQLKN